MAQSYREYSDMMTQPKLESKFVRRVMAGASEVEIEEATRRWFDFLRILGGMARRLDREARDSRESKENDRFRDEPRPL